MEELSWLHLSDWHQKGSNFDRDVVRDALIEDIALRTKIDPKLKNIDFIIFSGDIAFSGKKEEYDTALNELLNPILETCGLNPKRVFIVPGNHDMDREITGSLPSEFQGAPKVDDREIINEWLTNDKKRCNLMEPFQAFSSFVKHFTGQEQPDYSNIREWTIRGKKVAVLGLNSAWMCARNVDSNKEINDRGFVVIGEPQIHEKLKQIYEADLKIVVIHHPFDWLIDFDYAKTEEQLKKKCDFILYGHQHRPGIKITREIDSNYVAMPAGACYERRTPKDSHYANAYSFVHVDLYSGKGVVYIRRWDHELQKWLRDNRSDKNGVPFILPGQPLFSQETNNEPKGISQLRRQIIEWKHIHTKTHSLINKFIVAQGFLSRGFYSEASSEISRCFSDLNAMHSIAKDFSIINDKSLRECLKNRREGPSISKRIALIKKSSDTIEIQNDIVRIKGDLETTLKVADFKIVELIGEMVEE